MARDLRKLLLGMTQKQKRELFELLLQDFSQRIDFSEQDDYINPVDEMQSLAENLGSAGNREDIQILVDQIAEQADRIPYGQTVIRLCLMFKCGDVTRSDVKAAVEDCAKSHNEVFREIEDLAKKRCLDMRYSLIKMALQIF